MNSAAPQNKVRFADCRSDIIDGMAALVDLFVHLVWSTSGRAPWIEPKIEKPLYNALVKKCRSLDSVPIAIGGTADHVHLLVGLSPAVSLAKLVKELKGSSSHLLNHQLLPNSSFRWQRGYGAFSLRKTELPVVRAYVLNQKNHHRCNSLVNEWEADVE